MFGLWCGIAFFLLFWLTCVRLAGFVPPPSPTLSGQELLEVYKGNIFGIRLAMMLAMIAAVLLIPWSATLSLLMACFEGLQPMMSITAFGAGVANAAAFYLPFVFWAAGTYRLDHAPELGDAPAFGLPLSRSRKYPRLAYRPNGGDGPAAFRSAGPKCSGHRC